MSDRYGDNENADKDSVTVYEILDRQGYTFSIDVLAEHAGRCATKYNVTSEGRASVMRSLLDDLREALLERLQ
jgi:hypothetical protein